MTKKRTDVGYGKPPAEHQFKKGRSGNPNGRPKKPNPGEADMASLLQKVGNQMVEIAGEQRTALEVELMQLQRKAMLGDVSASRHLARLREKAGLVVAAAPAKAGGGVLVVPAPMSFDEWGAKAREQQAKFRGADPEGLERLMQGAGLKPKDDSDTKS